MSYYLYYKLLAYTPFTCATHICFYKKVVSCTIFDTKILFSLYFILLTKFKMITFNPKYDVVKLEVDTLSFHDTTSNYLEFVRDQD